MTESGRYQVIVLPLGEVNSPRSWLAWCPFTHISAEGVTQRDAKVKWEAAARSALPCLPEEVGELEAQRKVLTGVVPGTSELVYLVDEPQSVGQLVALFPSNMRTSTPDRMGEVSGLFDWKVSCTRVVEFPRGCAAAHNHSISRLHYQNPMQTTLTPNVIN